MRSCSHGGSGLVGTHSQEWSSVHVGGVGTGVGTQVTIRIGGSLQSPRYGRGYTAKEPERERNTWAVSRRRNQLADKPHRCGWVEITTEVSGLV